MSNIPKSLAELNFRSIKIHQKEIEAIKEIQLREGSSNYYLFILLHGWTNKAKNLSSLAQTILEQEQFQEATIVIPELPIGLFSISNPEIIARDIVLVIDNLTEKSLFDNIYFIGHSAGALITRKIYLCAYGEIENNFEDSLFSDHNALDIYGLKKQRKWVKNVNRIILLAGMNRGWSSTPALSLLSLFGTDFVVVLDTLSYGLTKRLLIFKVRHNSPFIANLRIQWMALSNSMKINQEKVLIVQLIGTIDDVVSPQDNIDFVTGQNFHYMEVPKTGHADIIRPEENEDRKKIIRKVLISTPDSIYQSSLSIDDLEDLSFPFPKEKKDITDVVFIVHGIRDRGFWTKKIAINIKLLGKKEGKKWATETSTYGYFGFLPFLISSLRQNKVEWLIDEYIENKALYPNARFHYVGHSNGTYLIAKALEDYPWCQFHHIVFAGSVVTENYDWEAKIKKKQVEKILNFVATGDWVVGIFPNSLGQLPFWRYFGGAGYKGFNFNKDELQSQESKNFKYETNREQTIHQLKFISGDHGAALTEENWEIIANFIVKGEIDLDAIEKIKVKQKNKTKNLFQTKQNVKTVILSTLPFNLLIFISIWLILIGIGFLIVIYLPFLVWVKTLLLVLYIFCVWQFLTRI